MSTTKKPAAAATATSSKIEISSNISIDKHTTKDTACQVDKLSEMPQGLSRRGSAVASSVVEALTDFCRQNAEFRQAVEQGGSLKDCIESTVKGVGSSISDLEVYRKAVRFFFPGAEIHMTMTLDLGNDGFSNTPVPEQKKAVTLDLDSLLDF